MVKSRKCNKLFTQSAKALKALNEDINLRSIFKMDAYMGDLSQMSWFNCQIKIILGGSYYLINHSSKEKDATWENFH